MTKLQRLLLAIPSVIVLGLIVMIIVTGLRQQENLHEENNERIQVVSSLNTYGEMAQAVGGSAVSVTNIINKASVDPHDFEPTANVAASYQHAQVIISNGGGYDTWSTNFASANQQAHSISVAKLMGYRDGDNEHFWYQPAAPDLLVKKLVAVYSQLDPDNAAMFKANGANYLATLQPLVTLRSQIEPMLNQQEVLTTEPVFDNTLKALGAKIAVPEFAAAVESGDDPSSATIQAWEQAVNSGKVKLVIQNPQTSSRLVKQAVAYERQHHIPVVQITETKPNGETFLTWQQKQLEAVKEALHE